MLTLFLDKFFPACSRCGTRWHDRLGEQLCSLQSHVITARKERIAQQAAVDADTSLEPKRLS